MERTLLSHIELVYPPISNQEGDWLWEVPEVREHVKRSQLYMIAQRPELKFVFNVEQLTRGEAPSQLEFSIVQDVTGNNVTVVLSVDPFVPEGTSGVDSQLGPKLIKFFTASDDLTGWFTPDKLLFDFWRGHLPDGLQVQGDYRKLTEFELLYVGISKKGDSFSRLFRNGHEKRAKILSNQNQLHPTARLTDELTLFLFDIQFMGMDLMIEEADIPHLGREPERAALVADAEKAFVHILDTKYNEIKYTQYPLALLRAGHLAPAAATGKGRARGGRNRTRGIVRAVAARAARKPRRDDASDGEPSGDKGIGEMPFRPRATACGNELAVDTRGENAARVQQ